MPGSGRNPAFSQNFAKWGYDPTHNYAAPDTTANVGQVVID